MTTRSGEGCLSKINSAMNTDANVEKELMAGAKSYADHDTTIVGEDVLLIAKISAGFGSGVLILTDDRLVCLRKKNGETYIERDTKRSSITELDAKPISGKSTLRFKDSGRYVIYSYNGDDLEPFVEPLMQDSKKNSTVRENREANRVHVSSSTGSTEQVKSRTVRESKPKKQQSKTTRISDQYERGKRLQAIGGGGCAISVIVFLIVAYLIPGLNVLAIIATVIGIVALLVYKFGKSEQEDATKDATVASLLNSDDKNDH